MMFLGGSSSSLPVSSATRRTVTTTTSNPTGSTRIVGFSSDPQRSAREREGMFLWNARNLGI